jgi:CarD family transcriptional regulator
VTRQSPDAAAASWSRRYRANLQRLASGDRDQIAEVVNELSARERDHGLSAGEQRMLERARRLLAHPDSS